MPGRYPEMKRLLEVQDALIELVEKMLVERNTLKPADCGERRLLMPDPIDEARWALDARIAGLTLVTQRDIKQLAARLALASFDQGRDSRECTSYIAPCIHQGGKRVCAKEARARLEGGQPC